MLGGSPADFGKLIAEETAMEDPHKNPRWLFPTRAATNPVGRGTLNRTFAAAAEVKAMQAEVLEWGEGYRPVGRQAVAAPQPNFDNPPGRPKQPWSQSVLRTASSAFAIQ